MKGLLSGFVIFLLGASSAWAADVKFSGHTYTYSCGYFSAMAGEYWVEFKDESLPWGTTVTVHYGLGDYRRYAGEGPRQVLASWNYKRRAKAVATAPYTWAAHLPEMTLHSRSSQRGYNVVEFVIEARLPDGTVRFERGGKGNWGYYAANVWESAASQCISTLGDKPSVREFHLEAFDRH